MKRLAADVADSPTAAKGGGHAQKTRSKKKDMTKKKIVGLVLLGAFVVMQFFQIDKTTQPVDATQDFIALMRPNPEVEKILRDACYDCHSQQTVYPFYTYINPLGWWIGAHVRNGRKKLDFSRWASYEPKKQAHKLEECVEYTVEKKMPLASYTWAHPEAKLSEGHRQQLVNWFKSIGGGG